MGMDYIGIQFPIFSIFSYASKLSSLKTDLKFLECDFDFLGFLAQTAHASVCLSVCVENGTLNGTELSCIRMFFCVSGCI